MAKEVLNGEQMSAQTRIALRTVVQYLHLLAVVLAIGGVFFAGFLLVPALALLAPDQAGQLVGAIMPTFSIIVWLALPTFLVTGVFMWFFRARDSGMAYGQFLRTRYSLLLIVKVVLAHVIAAISLLLTLPIEAFAGAKQQMPTLLQVNGFVALAILAIAAWLRRTKVG
jgi:uncharacterized membrane protein